MEVETRQYEPSAFKQQTTETTPTKLDLSIQKIIKDEGYLTYAINKKNISSNGGNYLGVLYEVDIKGKTVDGDKETHIFVKCMAPEFACTDLISPPEVYQRELFVYKELSRVIEDVQNEANVPAEERFIIVKAFEASYSEALLLDNLTRKGYKTWYRMDILTVDLADLCIKQLAKFHALSFVLERKRPAYFNAKLRNLRTPMKTGKGWEDFCEKMQKDALAYIDHDLKVKIEKKLPVLMQKFVNYLVYDEENHICMCHGDYRPNNIMIKENEGRITDAIPVDYQLICRNCPLLDFYYFIYTSTDYQFRRTHMECLKNLYYSTMKQYLRWYNIDIELVFPRNRFEKMYEEKMDYGLMITVLYLPFMLVSEDEVPDIAKDNICECEMVLDDRFRDRFTDVIRECMERGIL